jgi:hypothetical protein
MAYFEDLSRYSFLASKAEENAINAGWLDNKHSFLRGDVSTKVIEAVFALCLTPVNRTRGHHTCPFCMITRLGLVAEENGKRIILGSAEIRLRGQGRTYASPNLIYHYMKVHKYLPPEEFIAALMAERQGATAGRAVEQL